MTETEWLTSADPVALVNYLIYEQKYTPGPVSEPGIIPYRRAPLVSNRKLRLFACACCRRALMVAGVTDDRPLRTVAALERERSDELTRNRMRASEMRDKEFVGRRQGRPTAFSLIPAEEAAWSALDALCIIDDDNGTGFPVNVSGFLYAFNRAHANTEGVDPNAVAADLLREVTGNPFRPPTLSLRSIGFCAACGAGRHDHCGAQVSTSGIRCGCQICWGRPAYPWLTPTVLSLATAAYEHRTSQGHLDPSRLAVLADALEEAGCPPEIEEVICCCGERLDGSHDHNSCGPPVIVSKNHLLLSHLRGPGPHVRGCWSLDLVLGKN